MDVNLVKQTFLFKVEKLFTANIGKNKISRNFFKEVGTLACAIRSLTKTHTRSLITVICAKETEYLCNNKTKKRDKYTDLQ